MKNLKLLCVVVLVYTKTVSGSTSADEVHQRQKNDKPSGGSMYPRATATRDVRTLDEIWNFRAAPEKDQDAGFKEGWFKQDLAKSGAVIPMPVPSSYNDIVTDNSLRNHVGPVWYDRRFYVPTHWSDKRRVCVRFSSVHYDAHVWVNGAKVADHYIGHLPFEADITEHVNFNDSNLLTVAVNNSLYSDTVPQGTTGTKVRYTFDFFNYAGIHRTVFLFSTPQTYIDDVTVTTSTKGSNGIVDYNVSYKGSKDIKCLVELFDRNDTKVATLNDCAGSLEVSNANLWWPYQMNPHPGYLYTIKTSLTESNGDIVDTYYQKIGIRTVKTTDTSIMINGKSIYLRGFGMHEDSEMRGRGWDPVLWVKNFNLIRWTGANAFRTSHYPYAEEIYQLADEQGIMIIDECPSVNAAEPFSDGQLKNHKQSITELVRRDKNHPSVVMWSAANEPQTELNNSEAYFKDVITHLKSLDDTRPVTMAIAQWVSKEHGAQFVDVLSFNRYNGWLSNELEDILAKVMDEADKWHTVHKKPVIMSEYGAGTIAGMHSLPEEKWSEEYQLAVMSKHFKAFDKLKKEGYFVGEFIWNFADFSTETSNVVGTVASDNVRVGGNRKGIFTRSRHPKASAHHLRARYQALAAAENNRPPPDLDYYISDNACAKHEIIH